MKNFVVPFILKRTSDLRTSFFSLSLFFFFFFLSSFLSLLFSFPLKGQVQGLGWFFTRFPLKFDENNDVGGIVIRGL